MTPLCDTKFDVHKAPDVPPSASMVSSSTAADGIAMDAINDNPIDVRPPYSVNYSRLK
jgi:hypothetical protein